MYIIILAIIGIILGLIDKEKGSVILLAFTGAGIGLIICFIVSAGRSDKLPSKVIQSTPIYSLQDNALTSGHFFLGGGSINEKPVYSYYIKGEYGYKLGYTNAEIVEIIESNSTPRVEISRKFDPTHKPWYKTMIWFINTGGDTKRIIYVPKGTIIRNFNLDSKY